MAEPVQRHSPAALRLAREIVREAAIEGVRTDLFMVSVMGSVIAWIQSSRGAEHAESVARGASFGCMEIAAVIREGGEP
jgi:hypothetical protein